MLMLALPVPVLAADGQTADTAADAVTEDVHADEETEEPEIVFDDSGKFFDIDLLDFSDGFIDSLNITWLMPVVFDRTLVRRIRFDQQPIQRHFRDHLCSFL